VAQDQSDETAPGVEASAADDAPAETNETAAVIDEGDVGDDPDAEPASAIHELGSYIRHQRETARLSLRKLAKQAGVSNPYLSQIERGLRKPSAEILQAIAKALEISSETLYVKAGILEEREGDETLEDVVRRDPHLTDAQRQALVEMYRSFRRLSELQRPGRSTRLRGLLDAARVGDVDDASIQAASPQEEPEDGLGG
jgi:transcriptional regulator with XRE-family HTH domain